jgi:hypothetical protein
VGLLRQRDGHKAIFGASDGGLRKITKQYGAYGWVVATYDAKLLWCGKGPAPGSPNSSYRTEAYGMLGFQRMIYHVMTYWNIEVPKDDTKINLRFYTDSLSLISKITTLRSYGNKWYPSIHTWPHADILLQIKAAAIDMEPFILDMRHVKAHQDDDKEYEVLEDDEKLNYHCDLLATEALEQSEKGNRIIKITPFPACKVYLEENGELVNANEQQRLRQAIPRRKLADYYRNRYKWSKATYKWINWDDFGRARKRNQTTKRYVTALCCCWLPTNYRMEMTDNTSNACKQCAEKETTQHLFSCSGRTAWRKSLYERLYKFLTNQSTAPELAALILNGLRWHYEDHQPTVDLDSGHQQAIGWEHIFRGWLDRAWQPIQEKYVRRNFPGDKKKIEKCRNWSMYLIEYMWRQGHDLWKERCDKVHASTGKNETEQQRRVAVAQVNAMYKQAEDVGHYDRSRMFGKTVEEKLEESVPRLQMWIDQAKPAVKQAAKEFKKRMKNRHQEVYGVHGEQGDQSNQIGGCKSANEPQAQV